MTVSQATREANAEQRIAVIRTSDRSLFKRCRRKWNFLSGLRQNLTEIDRPSYFWIGTGGHFALEDHHGYNYYGHPSEAFEAYVRACHELAKNSSHQLPADWKDQTELAKGILENYLNWSSTRDVGETVWIDGEPQVEITGHLDLDVEPPPGYNKVVYQFTLDRLTAFEDEIWIQDWKFFKSFSTNDLDMDSQMGAYTWVAKTIFGDQFDIAGAILHEFRKDIPAEPKILQSGKLSSAKHQKTTHKIYRDALLRMYGEVDKAPTSNVKCLNDLVLRETPDRDDFIRRRRTRRTLEQQQAEGTRLMMELEDILNPNLPLYINQTKDCDWDCALRDICVMIERDDDWKSLLEELMVSREEEPENWRQYLT